MTSDNLNLTYHQQFGGGGGHINIHIPNMWDNTKNIIEKFDATYKQTDRLRHAHKIIKLLGFTYGHKRPEIW